MRASTSFMLWHKLEFSANKHLLILRFPIHFYGSLGNLNTSERKIIINKSANNEREEKTNFWRIFLRQPSFAHRISILTTRIPSVTRDFSLFPRRGTLRVADDYYCSACAERKAFSRRGFKKDFSLRRPGGERLLIFLLCRPIDIAIFKPCSVAIGIISFYGAQQSL